MKHAARRRAPVSSRSSATTASIFPRIEVPAGQPVTLRFLRQDPSPCAEKALFDELGVSADLPVGKPLDVTVTPPRVAGRIRIYLPDAHVSRNAGGALTDRNKTASHPKDANQTPLKIAHPLE